MQVGGAVALREEERMTRPLTKRQLNGELYTRPPTVEAQINEALKLDLAILKQRLEITDSKTVDYLRSECLVHLIRKAKRTGDNDRTDLVLPVLLLRCETILQKKISDRESFDAESLRDEVLGQFGEMLASDGTDTDPNELDFYECRFNLAFRTFRIDLVEEEKNRLKNLFSLPSPSIDEQEERDEDVLARLSDAVRIPATQESSVFLSEIWEVLIALPAEERRAVILCRVMGYKVESQDPNEVTAATRCNCSGRTIRNRLAQAATKLARC